MELGIKENPASTSSGFKVDLRWVTLIAVVLMLAGISGAFHSLRGNPYWVSSVDLGCYVNASHRLLSGQSPYNSVPDEHAPVYYGKPDSFGYGYPPVLAEILIPSLLVGDSVTRYGWFFLSAGILFAAIILLLRGFGSRLSWPLTLLACGIISLSSIVRDDLYHGQVNFLLLFLLVGGLWLLKTGKVTAAGLAWGLMIVIKPFLGVLLFYLLRRREFRAAVICLTSVVVLLALSFAPLFYHGHGRTAIHEWVNVSHWYSSWARPDNFSLHGVFLRLFTVNPYTIPWADSPAVAQIFSMVSALLLLALFLVSVPFRQIAARSDADADTRGAVMLAEVGLVLGLSMTYGPLTEGDHLLLLLPGLVGVCQIAYPHFVKNRAKHSAWVLAAVAWILFSLIEMSPLRGLPQFGIPSPMAWTMMSGVSLLWTAQIAVLLAILVFLLANALRQQPPVNIQAAAASD